jgi:hypothetical protein
MNKRNLFCVALLLMVSSASGAEDKREWVKLPEMMQEHMLANMRNHLESINLLLQQLAAGQLDQAAETAEQRLGMSSLDKHGASHLAQFMPEPMQAIGTRMHHAASRFALKAQEGEVLPAYAALQEVTAACVACHGGYRIR